jgi:large conductance mechanosensitive channel
MLKEFREFIMKGNVLDFAVGVIIAGAFGTIVTSLTNDIIMPPIGLALGGVDFSSLAYTLQAAEVDATGKVIKEAVAIKYGSFIQTIINFLIISFAIFLLVKTYNKITTKKEEAPAAPPAPSAEEVLLAEIRDLLKRS